MGINRKLGSRQKLDQLKFYDLVLLGQTADFRKMKRSKTSKR